MADPTINWLLEADEPAVRYATLTRLLGRPERSAAVRRERNAIMKEGVVPAILDQQNEDGSWGRPASFYTGKYRSTVWQVIILAEHFADGQNIQVRKACEFLLAHSQEAHSGGFATREGKRTAGGLPSGVVPCLTGNLIFSLLRLGYGDDPRLERGIDWLTKYLRFDDGDTGPPAGFPYAHWEICYGTHSCFMGVVKGLKALAEIPPDGRSAAVLRTLDAGAEFMLKHHIFKRSHDLSRVSKPAFKRFGFPRMYQTDALEILRILLDLGHQDERMQEALDLVISLRGDDGRWRMRDSFNGKFLVDVERQGAPSRWITLHALCVLQAAAESR